MRSHRALVVLPLVAALAVTAGMLLRWGARPNVPRSDLAPTGETAPGPGPAPAGGDDAAPSAHSHAIERTAVVPKLLVVSAATGAALPAATGTWIEARSDQHALLDAPVVHADEHGGLHVHPDQRGRRFLVRASRHVPFVVLPESLVDGALVPLQPAAVLEVTVLRVDGRPVTGFHSVLTHQPAGVAAPSGASGIGHPLASHPRWSAIGDMHGLATHDELPPGRYFLNVYADHLLPIENSWHNAVLELSAGVHRTAVTVETGYAAVFQCPSESPVRDVSWSVDRGALDTSPRVAARLGLMRQAMLDRFPNGLVYAHCPSVRSPVGVRCYVVLEDESRWSAAGELAPVDSIEHPTILEPDPRPLRPLVVEVVDPDGRTYAGIPIACYLRDRSAVVKAATGERVLLPHGVYRIESREPVLYPALHDLVVTVDERSPELVTARLDEPISELVVTFRYPSAEDLGPLIITFRDERNRTDNRVNYFQRHGPERRRLRGKTVAIEVQSRGYETVSLAPVPLSPEQPTYVEVGLQLKAR